jgi:hypothetical protein
MADIVAFLLELPTFDVIRLNDTGILAANGPSRNIPAHLPHLLCSGRLIIRTTPAIADDTMTIMVIIRFLSTQAAAKQTKPIADTWSRPLGAVKSNDSK